MPNAFKQKQDKAKLDRLVDECKQMIKSGAAGRHRAIAAYAKQRECSKEQAEHALGLR
jgi:hypothetical protein